MKSNFGSRLRNIVSRLSIIVGIGIIIISIGSDYLVPGSEPGFGRKQLITLVAGILIVILGWFLGNDIVDKIVKSIIDPFSRYWQLQRLNIRHQPLRIFLIAAIIGLISGFLEAIVYSVLSIWPDRLGWRNDLLPQILWIAPIANLVIFSIVASIIDLAEIPLKFRVHDGLLYLFLGWMGLFGPLAAFGKIHAFVSAFLAFAIIYQIVSYFLGRYPIPNVALAKGFGMLSTLLVAVAIIGTIITFQDRTARKLPSSKLTSTSPNVLLIVVDTLRADHLSSFGYLRNTTPNLDRLQQEGATFVSAYATASWTLPSHASLFTGVYPQEHLAGGEPLDNRYPTLAEVLSENGYVTAGFSANNYYVTPGSGLGRGFDRFEVYFSNVIASLYKTYYGKFLLDRLSLFGDYDIPGRKHAVDVNGEVLGWINSNNDRPFFVFLNYFDVHDPYIAPQPYRQLFTDQPTTGDLVNSNLYPRDFTGGKTLSNQQIEAEIDGYDASLAYLDNRIGDLINKLDQAGVLDNTVLVITSDHGESFGNHGLYGHGNSLYMNLLHVPLLIRYPAKVPEGIRISDPVEIQSLPSTTMDLLGLSAQSAFEGQSLTGCWSKSSTARCGKGFAIAESLPGIVPEPTLPLGRRGAIKSYIDGKWHLILHEEGHAELYRIEQDPKENDNLAKTKMGIEKVGDLATKLSDYFTKEDWKLYGKFVPLHAGSENISLLVQ